MAGETAVRDIGRGDLDTLAALDKRSGGASRQGFFSKRLANQARHPDAFVSMAALVGESPVAFALCHVIDGEFGGTERMAILDALGVDPDHQGRGIGHGLLDALTGEICRRGGTEIRTQARWDQRGLVDFFSSTGFSLAPRLVLECGPETRARVEPVDDDPDGSDRGVSAANLGQPDYVVEVDFSDASGDDFTALSRDRIPIRSLQSDDREAVVRIDRDVNGRDRSEYFERKFPEVLEESGVRISLVAEIDGQVAGFIMARVDYGEFGKTGAVAVFDNIAVSPSARGQHVGPALMDQLLANLRSLRVDVARTEVDWDRFDLNRFLARCGFRPADRLALSRRLD